MLLAAGFIVLGLGAGTVRVLQLDWYANHKALNTRIGNVDWVKYGFKRTIYDIRQQLFLDDRKGLPQVRLYIPFKSLEALMDNPPDSTKQWRRAFMLYPNGSIERIKVRYRGDNPVNWLYSKKSIRIKTRKKRLLNNRRVLNYNVPQSPTLMELYLGFQTAKDTGILSPDARLVEMFINDQPYGVLVEYDQPGEVFLRNSGQMPVNLYKGEQAHIERSEGVELDLYDNPALWEKVAVGNDLPENDSSDLASFLGLIRSAVNDDEAFGKLKRVAPFSTWARFAAYQTLTQNAHNTGYHNQRLVVDPWRGDVSPVINDPQFLWDGGLNQWHSRMGVTAYRNAPKDELEIDTQSLFRIYNRDSAFTLAKYRYLYDFLIKDGLLGRARQRIAATTEPLLISAGRDGDIWQTEIWPGFPFNGPEGKLRGLIGEYTSEIAALEAWLIEQLTAAPGAGWQNTDKGLLLGISGGAPLDGVVITLRGGAPVPKYIAWDADADGQLDPGDMAVPFKTKGQTVVLDAAWLANRPAIDTSLYRQTTDYPRVLSQPVPTRFALVADVKLEVSGVTGRNALTGKSFDLQQAVVDGAWPSRRNRPVSKTPEPSLQVWSGEKIVDGTQYIDVPVRIEPGTVIRLMPNANLVFRRRVEMLGNARAPVVITPATAGKTFGLIALQGPGTAGSSLRYLDMDNGSGGRLDNIQYTAMLNIHNTRDITLSHLKLRDSRDFDDTLHVIYSDNVLIDGIDIRNANSDAVDIDISTGVRFTGGIIEGSGNDGIDLMSSNASIEGVILSGNKDKGISVGEATEVVVKGSRIEFNQIGIESKDGSVARAIDTTFAGNVTQLNANMKNWRYGSGGQLDVRDSVFTGNNNVIKADKKSTIRVADSQMTPLVGPGKRVVFENVRARP